MALRKPNPCPRWHTFKDKKSGREYPVYGYKDSLKEAGIFITYKENINYVKIYQAVVPDGKGSSIPLLNSTREQVLKGAIPRLFSERERGLLCRLSSER